MDLDPTDPAEAVAIYRATVIGPLMHRVLTHGQLAAEPRALSTQRFRPQGAASTRTYSIPTLERWLYALRSGSLDALRPQPRSDRGFAQDPRALTAPRSRTPTGPSRVPTVTNAGRARRVAGRPR
jgi:putative transposase